ncbi:outer membrane beta-barrel protein [Bythopirellula goksoeyrii]|nr:outer membrane beta-barrel protein [Bythopirellula goksoeyrii]
MSPESCELSNMDFYEAKSIATKELVVEQGELVASASAVTPCRCDSEDSCCGCNNPSGCSCSTSVCDEDEIGLLQGMLDPCSPFVIGGWTTFGYYNKNTRQSFDKGDLLSYNDVPNRLNIPQSWLYLGKEADGSQGLDFGFRVDAVYGTDAQSLQATGNPGAQIVNSGTFDASWDHGVYGWAMPQLYGEVAYEDWSVIAGYFLSPIGYESSRAIDNFFFSHSLTMFNSEPFTNTGVLAKNTAYEGVTFYAGWTLGWDTAFDQNLGGNSGIGGFVIEPNDLVTFTYLASAGDFGFRGDDGYNHSIVLELLLTDKLEYALQSDYVRTNNSFATPGFSVEEFGVVQYVYYQLNDKWWAGGRAEWWKSNSSTPDQQSYNDITLGLNYEPRSNIVFRPEIRYDWTPAEDNFAAAVAPNYNQWVTAIDCVITY